MTTTATISSGDAVTPGSATQIPCFVDVCSAGTVGTFYGPFFPGNQVTDQLGGGPLADQVLAFLSSPGGSAGCYAIPVTPTWSSQPSVVHTGSGPTVTTANAAGASGPFDSHTRLYTILTSGPNGQAMMSVSYDGGAAVETLPVPAATPGYLAGTAPITPTVLGTVSATTLVFDSPSAQTLTFPTGSLVSSAAGLKAATATVTSPSTVLPAELLSAGLAALAANPRRLSFTTAGTTPAHVPATVTITGTDYSGAVLNEAVVPNTSAGPAYSAYAYAAITSLVFSAAGGTDATIAIGYLDAYASHAELIAEAQTLATVASLAVTVSDAQSGTGHYMAFTTTSTGSSATVSFDASPGTGAAMLGFTASESNTGATGAYSPPWTGATDTFPTGSYVAGASYKMTCTGPTASTAAVVAGLSVARANWQTHPFGGIYVTAPPSSAANAAALQAACSSTVNAWRTDNSLPVAVVTGTAFHTASSVPATNQANITTNDAAHVAAFAGNPAALDLVCVGDWYVQGSKNLRPGSFRRSTVLAAAIQRASLSKLGASIAEGIVPGGTLRGPDQITLARDENTATVKLGPSTGGNTGPGFCVLKATSQGVGFPKFPAGVTRAGATSRLRSDNAVFTALRIQVVQFAIASSWEGETWETSPAKTQSGPAGQITDAQAASKADDVYNALLPDLLPVGKPPSVSGVPLVSIDNSGVFINTGLVPLTTKFIPLGPVSDVDIATIAVGVITTTASTTIS